MASTSLPRILMVDDDALVREVTAEGLRRHGFDVDAPGDGRTALALLRREVVYDLLLLDDQMPGLTGCQLLAALRGDGIRTAAIVYSGSLHLSDAERVTLQVDRVIAKPAALDELVSAIRRALGDQ
jgi:two-component system response regulator MtrA